MNSMRLANKLHLHSLAMPAISSGIFGFPKQLCAEIMIKAAEKYANIDVIVIA
jgi:O-acetyl-ADP-ribose deacetylase (regulator of RNase III)